MAGTNNSAIPSTHHNIIAVFKAIRARTIADTLFALFELFKQAEVAWDYEELSVAAKQLKNTRLACLGPCRV